MFGSEQDDRRDRTHSASRDSLERMGLEPQASATPMSDAAVLRGLSDQYAVRIEELNGLRERLDEIGDLLSNHLSDAASEPLSLDGMKRILELAQHDR